LLVFTEMEDGQGRLRRLIGSFRDKKIAVVGDLILDEYIWGNVSRISPEAPVPVVEVKRESLCLGGAANVALNLCALGARPLLAGVLGEDVTGERLLQLLQERGINADGVTMDSSRRTTLKTRIIAHHQQVCRADREFKGPLGKDSCEALLRTAEELIRSSDAVILSDYGKGVFDAGVARRLLDYARELNRFVAVDPKNNDVGDYRGASVITPNKREAELLSGTKIFDAETLRQAGRRIFQRSCAQYLLITRGEEGMTLFEGDTTEEIPTVAKEVFDVTGAGDTVIAVLTLAVAAGASLYEAAVLANHAAGLVVGKLGTASVCRTELLESIGSSSMPRQGL